MSYLRVELDALSRREDVDFGVKRFESNLEK